MEETILVALKPKEPIEALIPYLEQVGQPGMRVVFLIRYPVEPWAYWRDHWVTTESVGDGVLSGKRIMEQYSWPLQRGLADRLVSPVREALSRTRMEVSVDLYTGSLRDAIRDYVASGDVRFMVLPTDHDRPIMSVLDRLSAFAGLIAHRSSSPVLLLNPNHGARG